jgi:hypothetical protein
MAMMDRVTGRGLLRLCHSGDDEPQIKSPLDLLSHPRNKSKRSRKDPPPA